MTISLFKKGAKAPFLRYRRGNRGATALETALIMPFIFLFVLLSVQVAMILMSAQLTQYAAFMAARSYQVYGESTLGAIQYPYTAEQLGVGSSGGLYTNDSQTAAEATAEKIIFEGLPWEYGRIEIVDQTSWYLHRVYLDGNDTANLALGGGAVRVEFGTFGDFNNGLGAALNFPNIEGVKVTYCMPSLFAGIQDFVTPLSVDANNPCLDVSGTTSQPRWKGIPISYDYYLGREP